MKTILISISILFSTTFCSINDQSIKAQIFTDYDSLSPPSDAQIPVSVSFALLGVVEVNTVNSYAVLAGYIKNRWEDPRLQWDPQNHGGKETIRVNTDPSMGKFIWQPDINIYERNEQSNGFSYTGEVYLSRIGHYQLNVDFKLDDYPFDEQDIRMSLESWSYTDDAIRVQCDVKDPLRVVKEAFVENVEWKVVGQKEIVEFMNYTTGEYSRVVFMINIKRQGKTISKTVILPALFVTCLAFLYYFIPIGTGGRIGYLATILLTDIMFLVMLTTFVPVSKRTTGIVDMFFHLTVILFCLSVVVLLMDWYYNIIIQDETRNEDKEGEEGMELLIDEEGENNINASKVEEKEKLTTTIKKCMTHKRVILLDKIVGGLSFCAYVVVILFNMTAHNLLA